MAKKNTELGFISFSDVLLVSTSIRQCFKDHLFMINMKIFEHLSFGWFLQHLVSRVSSFLVHRNFIGIYQKTIPKPHWKSPIFNLEAISEAHVHLFSMDFPCQIHGKTWKTWAPTPRVACFPGSPVAGLCTEEAVTTTRAVGDKLGSILGMLGCGVCCWWCWERRSLMI